MTERPDTRPPLAATARPSADSGSQPPRWPIALAAFSGLIASSAAINTFGFSVLLKPLAARLAMSRGDLSTGIAIAAVITGVASLCAGYLMDRFGVRRVMVPGILLFALATASFGLVGREQASLVFVVFALGGLATTAQQPIGYVKIVSLWFGDRRGIALGVALAGVGVGTIVMPQLASLVNAAYGLSAAFVALAIAIVMLALIPVALTFQEPATPPMPRADPESPGAPADYGLRAALRDPIFWRINLALLLAVCAINGTLTHMVAMLTDRGMTPRGAVNVLSGAGLFIAIGRIAAGWALDRFRGQIVAGIFIAAPIAGLALLLSGAAAPAPVLGAVLCGLGVGAEVDLTAYFLGRYFGVGAIASLFGVSAAVLALATAIGPFVMGQVFDAVGSYTPALTLFEVLLLISLLLFTTLGPYRFPARSHV